MSKILETSQEDSTGSLPFDPHETDEGRLQRRWNTIIDASLANVPLLGCCFITGLLDTTMFQGKMASIPSKSMSELRLRASTS